MFLPVLFSGKGFPGVIFSRLQVFFQDPRDRYLG